MADKVNRLTDKKLKKWKDNISTGKKAFVDGQVEGG